MDSSVCRTVTSQQARSPGPCKDRPRLFRVIVGPGRWYKLSRHRASLHCSIPILSLRRGAACQLSFSTASLSKGIGYFWLGFLDAAGNSIQAPQASKYSSHGVDPDGARQAHFRYNDDRYIGPVHVQPHFTRNITGHTGGELPRRCAALARRCAALARRCAGALSSATERS